MFATSTVYGDSLDFTITSWHSDKSYNYNTKNYGIGYTKDLNRHWQAQVGFFKNSYNKDSFYFLSNLKHEMKGWNFGVAFGFVTGYDNVDIDKKFRRGVNDKERSRSEKEAHGRNHDKNSDKYKYRNKFHNHPINMNNIQFIVLPNITWKITNKHGLNLTYVPSLTKDSFSFAGVKYQYTLY